MAGEEAQARMAILAGERMLHGNPREQPFILALVRRDLKLTLNSLTQ
jgi:hypothetical protein